MFMENEKLKAEMMPNPPKTKFQMPKWNRNNFVYDETLEPIELGDITQQQMLGFGLLRSYRDEVVGRGFSLLINLNGRHRSGKSLASVTLGCLWDKTFLRDMEFRIVRDNKQFLFALEKIEKEGIQGAVIVVDEAGISASSGDWYLEFVKDIQK